MLRDDFLADFILFHSLIIKDVQWPPFVNSFSNSKQKWSTIRREDYLRINYVSLWQSLSQKQIRCYLWPWKAICFTYLLSTNESYRFIGMRMTNLQSYLNWFVYLFRVKGAVEQWPKMDRILRHLILFNGTYKRNTWFHRISIGHFCLLLEIVL